MITAFGRLGHWWGSEHFGIRPDLIVFAKAVNNGYLPLGGVLVGERVGEVLVDRGGEFLHGFTQSGNPTACAVAIANLRAMQHEGIVEHVREHTAAAFAQRWQGLAEHPLVGEARCAGMVGAIELVADKASRARFAVKPSIGERCRYICVDNGLVMRHVAESMIVAPPLVITDAQLDELVDKAWKCLDLTARDLGLVA